LNAAGINKNKCEKSNRWNRNRDTKDQCSGASTQNSFRNSGTSEDVVDGTGSISAIRGARSFVTAEVRMTVTIRRYGADYALHSMIKSTLPVSFYKLDQYFYCYGIT
jgi:hypothetical protein